MMIIKRTATLPKINSLLIDGECLLKQGFHGTKQILSDKGHVGAIFHFLNKIKYFYENLGTTKVIVFWEGDNAKYFRQSYYPYYKMNRGNKYTEEERSDLSYQRVRVKQYLEELFIRQVEVEGCEGDDGISYYVQNSPNETKTIISNDVDLLSLIDENVKVYLLDKKITINKDNFQNYYGYHYGNVGLIKMIAGDVSDNISGIQGIGEGKVLKFFPILKTEPKEFEWIVEETQRLLEGDPNNVNFKNILDGKTKWGSYGTDYFSIMNRIINLKQPYVTDELKEVINEVLYEPLLPDGRGGVKAIMEMMKVDGLLSFIPQSNDGYFTFWSCFLTIINKEQQIYNKTKKI